MKGCLLMAAMLLLSGCAQPVDSDAQMRGPYLVGRVIDGDTLALENGEKVRLIGIDAPEKGEAGYAEAKEFLRQAVEGKFVRMEGDSQDRDKYGRLLRYVFVGGRHVNIGLAEAGMARAYPFEDSTRYAKEIADAEARAIRGSIGIWSGAS